MHSLAVFFSYARSDDESENGRISELRKKLETELRILSGDTWEVFQDIEDIEVGQQWRTRLAEGLDKSTFFVAILTPTYFKRPFCRAEISEFIERENALGHGDLLFPILYLQTAVLIDSTYRNSDQLALMVADRQCDDWTQLRNISLKSAKARDRVNQLARAILSTHQRITTGNKTYNEAIELKAATPQEEFVSSQHQKKKIKPLSQISPDTQHLASTPEKDSVSFIEKHAKLLGFSGILAAIVTYSVASMVFRIDPDPSEPYDPIAIKAENKTDQSKDDEPKITEPISNLDFDSRSSKIIGELEPQAAQLALQLIEKANERGIKIRVISGLRTLKEQEDLYKKGRTIPGAIVTNSRVSMHCTGLAFDVGIFNNREYIPESSDYKVLGELGKSIGLIWGGIDNIPDEPHFEAPNAKEVLKSLRRAVGPSE